MLAVLSASGVGAQAAEWPDALLTTPGSPENIAKGQEVDAYQLGVSAWTWGYPLVRMERVMRDYSQVPDPKPATSYRAPLNQIGWARELATPSAKDMPTANNDTVYMSSVVLLNEPFVLTVPEMHDRYYVVDVFNMWQELQHYVGRRTTGTQPGRYALVPPGWKGKLPEGVKRLDVATSKVWLWGRMRVSPGEDMGKIHRLQDQFDLRPVSALGRKDWKAPKAELEPLPDIAGNPYGFLTHLARALKDNPVRPEDKALYGQLQRIGLTDEGFDPSQLSDAQKKGLERALNDAPFVAVAGLATSAQQRQGWSYVRGLDDFGFNYPLRSLVAGPYLGGQGEVEAVYPIRYTDSAGKSLDGSAQNYAIRFGSMPPNNAFWSVTMYDAKTKMLIDNPLNRYKVGSDTPGLKLSKDGSLEIPVSAEKPEGEFASNWLPAPKGPFYLLLRVYQPKQAVMSGEWKLPQVDQVK
jgi:hypothetical protein